MEARLVSRRVVYSSQIHRGGHVHPLSAADASLEI